MRPFDLVIFDLDGTLVDSAPDIAWALNAALDEAGLPTLPPQTVKALVGDGAAKLVERALPTTAGGLDTGPLLARFLTHYAAHLSVDSRLYPGVTDLLRSLSRAGVASAVITNKPHDLARGLLQALSIGDRFVTILGDGAGFPRKPHPSAAHSIIERVGTAASRTAVVGDGLPDMGLSRAIPCLAVAATWGYVAATRLAAESPAFMANSPSEAERFLLPGGMAQA